MSAFSNIEDNKQSEKSILAREAFLKALFGQYLLQERGYIETREFIVTDGNKRIIRKFHKTIDTIVQHIPTGDYYFGTCPRSKKSGKEKEVDTITALWVDLDIYKRHSLNKEAAIEELSKFRLPPSIIVGSGYGLQSYWLLKQPEKVRGNTKGVLKGLSETLKALGADNCFDLSRILRVPDTKNYKNAQLPLAVKVIDYNSNLKYDLKEFDSFEMSLSPPIQSGDATFSRDVNDVDVEQLKISLESKTLILQGKQENDKYPSRSEVDFRVFCDLIKAGCDDDTIKDVFEKYPIGNKYRKQGIAYLRHSINKARAAVESEKIAQESVEHIEDLLDGGNIRFNSVKVAERLLEKHKIISCGGFFYEYTGGCYRLISVEKIQRYILSIVGKKLTKHKTEEITYFLNIKTHVEIDDLNKSISLNLRNGLFALDAETLYPHTPNDLSTIQLNICYNRSAICHKWMKTVREIFENDENKISVLQEFFGLCLTRETRYEKALMCVGYGANGKSVILNTLEAVLGRQNYSSIPLEKFSNSHYLANLFGKLANISIETNAKSDVYDSTFKAIVSGDSIQADNKFKKPFNFKPCCKLIFALNNLPRVDDKTNAFYRRLLILRFNRSFEEIEQNKSLKEELSEELDGIFLWAVEGLKNLKRRGYFNKDKQMEAEIDDYKRENNNVIVFVDDACVLTPLAFVEKNLLYTEYSRWCHENGYKPLGKLKFGKELAKCFKLGKDDRTEGQRIWQGIRLA